MIRWKVVTLDRRSVVAMGKYRTGYNVGDRKKALAGTLGFMTFKRKRDAEDWRISDEKIIRVKTFGRGKIPEMIAGLGYESDIDNYYLGGNPFAGSICPPTGTICYQELEVLD